MGPGFESLKVHQIVSVIIEEGPPVPIPNTEVKLLYAEDTWRATARENRSALTRSGGSLPKVAAFIFSSLAQSVEHLTVNQGVVGSSPTGGAILIGQKCNLCQKALFYKAFSVF